MDKLQRQRENVVEDAERKRPVYEEEVAKVSAQKLKVEEVEKQLNTARAQVQPPSPIHPPLPSLPSEKEGEDGFDFDRGYETDGLDMETDGPASSGEEAGRDAALSLGIDLQERVAKRGRSASGAPPPPSQPTSPADVQSMEPAAIEQLARSVVSLPSRRRRKVGNLSNDDERWTVVQRSKRQHGKVFKRTLPCKTQVPGSC